MTTVISLYANEKNLSTSSKMQTQHESRAAPLTYACVWQN